jgi:hypothetical protein
VVRAHSFGLGVGADGLDDAVAFSPVVPLAERVRSVPIVQAGFYCPLLHPGTSAGEPLDTATQPDQTGLVRRQDMCRFRATPVLGPDDREHSRDHCPAHDAETARLGGQGECLRVYPLSTIKLLTADGGMLASPVTRRKCGYFVFVWGGCLFMRGWLV